MTSQSERNGALEAIERILNRGGDPHDVVRQVVDVLGRLYGYAAINVVGERKPAVGRQPDSSVHRIEFQGTEVAALEVAGATDDDAHFLDRVATIISPFCRP